MKLVREHINEKFTEDGDPITDMGIGIDQMVKEFEKDLYQVFPALYTEQIFKHISGQNLIRIDTDPFSKQGILYLKKSIRKLMIGKYKDMIEIINWPVINPYEEENDLLIKFK
jgi:hypothetical protein